MSLASSGLVASIVPFEPTLGIAAVASVMLTVFVIAMIAFAVAPLVSSSWNDYQRTPATDAAAAQTAEPSDD
ncbi:hypothetical protein [Natronolimnohabitans innermongolicus]|uniref:Uncharacterized protein n=1 Tax=Natronolimnohabitans innermongolicus JCM 12255 TaxID=1227499 RepID=L9XAH5_9EURY|nr:hypothetical protein [Natronolimnohabitans innermongolicus]ELY58632.1 hypothetical protein C493_06497 [Natronolimnohabitans innermongolicus JCM 12255]